MTEQQAFRRLDECVRVREVEVVLPNPLRPVVAFFGLLLRFLFRRRRKPVLAKD